MFLLKPIRLVIPLTVLMMMEIGKLLNMIRIIMADLIKASPMSMKLMRAEYKEILLVYFQ